jgi:carboxypeptidase PM20D1
MVPQASQKEGIPLKTLFADLWASLQIFYSNFNANYGRLFNAVLILLLLSLVLYALVRAFLAGRKGRRSPSPLVTYEADPLLADHAAESLARAIRIPSVTGETARVREMARFLRERYPTAMKELDCAVLPDGSMLLRWCSRQESPLQPVLFCGHLDVVPGGEDWTVCEPFDGLRQSGRIYGRGAMDCKGVVIAMLEAVENLIEQGHSPRRDIYFAFGSDEETGGYHGAAAIARSLAARETDYYTCHCTGVEQYGFMGRYMPRLRYLACGESIVI